MLLLVWCPGGYERPYACPKAPDLKNGEKIYYIRKLSSTIEAIDMDVKELMSLSHNIPFDCHICCMGVMAGTYIYIAGCSCIRQGQGSFPACRVSVYAFGAV